MSTWLEDFAIGEVDIEINAFLSLTILFELLPLLNEFDWNPRGSVKQSVHVPLLLMPHHKNALVLGAKMK